MFMEHPMGLWNVDYITIKGGNNSYLRLGSVTTTQRDALPAIDGTLIYNKTTSTIQGYYDGSWVDWSAAGAGSDTTAIHDDTAGEIVAITEKTSPVGADEFLIEDSEDSNNKKSVKFSNLGSAGVPMKTSEAITIYVDTGGNDSTGDGSSGNPYLTVNKAVAHYLKCYPYIAHDCAIAIGAGTFTLTSAIDLAGLAIFGSLTFTAKDTSDNLLYDRGTADAGGGNNELDDTSKSWDVDEWNGGWVAIIKGTGAGQVRTISDTTATKLTVSVNWTTNPDATSVYVLSATKIDGNAAVSGCFTASRIDNVKLTGLYITGATGWQILNYYGFNWRVTAGLIDGSTTDNGIFQSGGSMNIRGTWVRADGIGILGQYQAALELASSGENAMCVIAGNAGTDTGLEANYSAAIYTSAGNITFVDWNKGIYAHNNSVVGNGLGQTFVNCTTNADPAAASDASFIEA